MSKKKKGNVHRHSLFPRDEKIVLPKASKKENSRHDHVTKEGGDSAESAKCTHNK